jgi:hypothetical protein
MLLLSGVLSAAPAMVLAEDFDDYSCCPLADERPPCVADSTDVVGYRHCPRYGAWGASLLDPYVYVDVGMNVRHFASRSAAVAARSTSPVPLSGNESQALTFDERIGYGITHSLYTAIDLELGNFDSSSATDSDVLFAGLASLGMRVGLGPIALAGEMTGGAMESSYPSQTSVHFEGILEARARADLWLAPWFSVGGVIGESLLDHRDWMAGVFIGFHTWGYAGDRWSPPLPPR